MGKEPDDSRRDFLRVAVVGGIALVTAAAGGVVATAPRVSGASGGILPLGPLLRFEGLEPGKPLEVRITLQRRDGWRLRTRPQTVFIQRLADQDKADDTDEANPLALTAFSPVCPHAGCTVEAHEDGFVCPCHDATFAPDGARKSGPAPRGLDPLKLEVREYRGEDWLYVHWKDYVPGQPERVARGA
jgi:Rieske Fe-S protein